MQLTRRISRDRTVFIAVGVLTLLVVLSYVGFFVLHRNADFGGPAEWGQFGDYLGGLVNPAVGIATVFLIIRTLRVTRREAAQTRKELTKQTSQLRRQIRHIKKQQILSEIKDRLDGVLADWNVEMDQNVGPLPYVDSTGSVVIQQYPNTSVRRLLFKHDLAGKFGTLSKSPERGSVQVQWNDRFEACLHLLDELESYTAQYKELGGSPQMTEFYCRRVQVPLRVFRAVGIVSPNEHASLNVGIKHRMYV